MDEQNITKIKKVGTWISALVLGNTRELIARIDERTGLMLNDLNEIKPKVNDMSPKVELLWKDKLAPSSSPRQLNDRGNAMLKGSGVKEIVDEKKSELLELVKAKRATNAYDAEVAILNVMNELPMHFPDKLNELKNGSFKVGASIEDVLFVGSIYLRNLIFPNLGFNVTDLDRPASTP